MRNFNLKKLFVTKTARLDLSMSKNKIYLIIYKPVDKKISQVGNKTRENPVFRKYQENGTVIEDKSVVKISEKELGIIITLLKHYIRLNYNVEKLSKLVSLKFFNSNGTSISADYVPEDKTLKITFFRPEKSFWIFFSDKFNFGISLKENGKIYTITISNEFLGYIKKAFEFALEEYFKNLRYDIQIEENSESEGNTTNITEKEITKNNNSRKAKPTRNSSEKIVADLSEIDDDDDDLDI